MTKIIRNTRRIALGLLVALGLLIALSAQALAAAGTDAVEIGEDGTVTIVSGRMAGEKISSLQVRIDIGAVEGENVGFAFDAGLGGWLTYSSYRDGALNIYVAGTAQLMPDGQDRLVLGTISGGDLSGALLSEDALRFVYGRRVIGQSAEARVYASAPEDGTGEEPAAPPKSDGREQLQAALEQAKALDPAGYTQTSYEALLAAIENAQTVLEDAGATPADIEAAAAMLQSAIDRLVPVTNADGSGPVIGDGADDGTGAGDPEPGADGAGPSVSEEFIGGTEPTPEVTDAAAPTASPNGGGQSGAPDTGDDAPVLTWTLVLCLSGALLAAICRRRSGSGL